MKEVSMHLQHGVNYSMWVNTNIATGIWISNEPN